MRKIITVVLVSLISLHLFAQTADYKKYMTLAENYENNKQWCHAMDFYYKAAGATDNLDDIIAAKNAYDSIANEILNGNPGKGDFDIFTIHDEWMSLLQEAEQYSGTISKYALYLGDYEQADIDYATRTVSYNIKYTVTFSNLYKYTIDVVTKGFQKAWKKDWNVSKNWPRESIFNNTDDSCLILQKYLDKTTVPYTTKERYLNASEVLVYYDGIHEATSFVHAHKLFEYYLDEYKYYGTDENALKELNSFSHDMYHQHTISLYDCQLCILDKDGKYLTSCNRWFTGDYNTVCVTGVTADMMKLLNNGEAYFAIEKEFLRYGEFSSEKSATDLTTCFRDYCSNKTYEKRIPDENIEWCVKDKIKHNYVDNFSVIAAARKRALEKKYASLLKEYESTYNSLQEKLNTSESDRNIHYSHTIIDFLGMKHDSEYLLSAEVIKGGIAQKFGLPNYNYDFIKQRAAALGNYEHELLKDLSWKVSGKKFSVENEDDIMQMQAFIKNYKETVDKIYEGFLSTTITKTSSFSGRTTTETLKNLQEKYGDKDDDTTYKSFLDYFGIKEAQSFLETKTIDGLKTVSFEMTVLPEQGIMVSKTEITQKVYETVMGENPSLNKGDYYPVENISYFDAIYFCNKLSVKLGYEPVYAVNDETDIDEWGYITGGNYWISGDITEDLTANGFRLLENEEWENAARAGKDYEYAGSNNAEMASWNASDSGNKSHPVGKKIANSYGLYDMSGNVWEYIWSPDYHQAFYMGGGFDSQEEECMVDNFDYSEPYVQHPDVGFRIACSAEN